MKRKKLGALLGVSTLVALGTVTLVTAAPALAHTTGFSGVASCQDDGTYTIHWSGHTDQVPSNDVARVKVTAFSGGGTVNGQSSATPPIQVVDGLAPNADYSFDQVGVPGTTTSASASVHVHWTGGDTFDADANGTASGLNGCVQHVPVPAQPQPTAPTCSSDGSLVIPANTDKVKWLVDGNQVGGGSGGTEGPGHYAVSAHTTSGYLFSDGNREEDWTINVAAQLQPGDGTCTTPVPVPAEPTINPASCTSGGTITIPANTDKVKWLVDGEQVNGGTGGDITGGPHTISAHTTIDYLFSDGNRSETWTETAPSQLQPGDGTCTSPVDVPAEPVVTPPTCDTDGYLTIPANTDEVKWLVDGVKVNGGLGGQVGPGEHAVSAHTTIDYLFSDGNREEDWTETVDTMGTGLDCRSITTPVSPVITQPVCDGPGTETSGSFTTTDTDEVKYTSEDNVVTATAQSGYKFGDLPDGWTSVDDTHATFTVSYTDAGACLVTLTPVNPSVTEAECDTSSYVDSEPTLMLADTEGITYSVAGDVKQGSTVTVTAKADEGYVLSSDDWSFVHTFATVKCDKPTPTPTPTPSSSTPSKPKPPTSTPPSSTLPKHLASTGFQTEQVGIIGVLILGLGALLALAGRRRGRGKRT